MFTISKNIVKDELISTTKILDHISIEDFINKKTVSTEILLCPVHAIDVNKREILHEKCISCGICWIKIPQYVEFDQYYSKEIFMKYCRNEKIFVYTWFSLILSNYSGINIKSRGFSRTKRIPLMILDEETAYIVKSSHTSKDFEKDYLELEDIISLSANELKDFKIQKIIIINDFNPNDKIFFENFSDTIFLSLEKILDNLLTKKYKNIKEHIRFSSC